MNPPGLNLLVVLHATPVAVAPNRDSLGCFRSSDGANSPCLPDEGPSAPSGCVSRPGLCGIVRRLMTFVRSVGFLLSGSRTGEGSDCSSISTFRLARLCGVMCRLIAAVNWQGASERSATAPLRHGLGDASGSGHRSRGRYRHESDCGDKPEVEG